MNKGVVFKISVHLKEGIETYYIKKDRDIVGLQESFVTNIMNCGYYGTVDIDGKLIMINPSDCGLIVIEEYSDISV